MCKNSFHVSDVKLILDISLSLLWWICLNILASLHLKNDFLNWPKSSFFFLKPNIRRALASAIGKLFYLWVGTFAVCSPPKHSLTFHLTWLCLNACGIYRNKILHFLVLIWDFVPNLYQIIFILRWQTF